MQAIMLKQFGSVDQLEQSEVPTPELKPKQVLVQNHAVALDPYDVKFVAGQMGKADKLPLIPGSSVVGTVVAVGNKVTDFKPGDRVAANRHHQTYAEFVPVGQSALARVPDTLDDATAVAAVLGATTGYQAVTQDLNVQAGEKVFIQGGTGSVGLTAVQAALNRGAKVYASASSAHFAFLKQFGDVHPIDYHDAYELNLHDFDAVLDPFGGQSALKSAQILKVGARLRNLSDDPNLEQLSKQYQIDAQSMYLAGKGPLLADLLQQVVNGKITLPIAKKQAFTLENLRNAHEKLRHASPLGKIILTF
ncbi:NADPH:quinone reductase-like Zn-dependent oxidoreductase [Weissella uvarum]|uniref:NADP-dependent oxidoreductase n=1 Tax=Weissella uvarum TaxID=1479233 RepID=UPI00195F913E|nr:NADP-dependent oxidoreductase [Weissella uvarum]MBM7616894.1 NADPH:quinone reductase-like Zn-dependent oxidoreductase [Weissella uvarum]MCM0594654.1 NADP-dependent oxidoreductase [Weissella uvarum]